MRTDEVIMSKKLKYIYQSPPHIKQNNTYFLTSGHKDSGTYSLEQAEHFCPLSKAERIVPFTTQSRINVKEHTRNLISP